MSIKVNELPIELSPALTDYTINDTTSTVTSRSTWQKILDLFSASGVQVITYLSGISAAGANQAAATSITKLFNRIDNVAAGTGVKNSATEAAGFARTVQNNGVNDLKWYPFGTNQFYIIGSGLQGASTPITIAAGNQASVIAYTAGVLTLV